MKQLIVIYSLNILKYSNRAFINNVESFVRAILYELESTIESLKYFGKYFDVFYVMLVMFDVTLVCT